jgi:glycosyltransferase involved in cell wall biosynthesis
MTSGPPLRVAILWKQLSGYWIACFRALTAEGVSIHLVHRATQPDAPYSDASLEAALPGHCWDPEPDEGRIGRELAAFAPDALLVASWDVGAYRHTARAMRGHTLRILAMDNQWLGTPKQWGGSLISRLAIRPCYDVVFLPGERQAIFARRLGFGDDRILWGFYTCDYHAFAAEAGAGGGLRPPAFVFAGRLSSEKGLDVLVDAYRRYRAHRRDPWPLVVCGTGPLAASLAGVEGIEARGFVQPGDLPSVFAHAACLVLPSTFEPWGVVVHEAVAAGLAIICSTAVGASSRFVVDGYNGALVPPGDPAALAGALDVMSDPGTPLADFSRRSSELARQFTPERWARYLVDQIVRRRSQGLGNAQP